MVALDGRKEKVLLNGKKGENTTFLSFTGALRSALDCAVGQLCEHGHINLIL